MKPERRGISRKSPFKYINGTDWGNHDHDYTVTLEYGENHDAVDPLTSTASSATQPIKLTSAPSSNRLCAASMAAP